MRRIPEDISTTAAAPPERILRLIVEATGAATGEEFFRQLVRGMAEALGFRYAVLGELVPGKARVRTLAFWTGTGHGENFEYDLAGTPCEEVVGKRFTYFPRETARRFPRDRMLEDLGIESYMGIPLFDAESGPLGLLLILHDRPTEDLAHAQDVLAIFANRASAELQRMRSEQALRQAREELEERVRERTAELRRANKALQRQIAERRLIESALRQSRQRYEGILDSQQTLVARADPEGRLTYVNEAYAQTFDLKLGDRFIERIHPEDHARYADSFAELRQWPHARVSEQRWRVGDQWRWILWQGSALHDEEGQLREIQGVGFDITDRKRAEEELKTVTSRIPCILWQASVEGLPGWEQDPTGDRRLLRWTMRIVDEEAAQRLLPLDVPKGQTYQDIWNQQKYRLDGDALWSQSAGALVRGEKSYHRDFRMHDRSGQLHWMHEELALEEVAAGRWQVFGVCTDVTASRQAAAELRTVTSHVPAILWQSVAEGQAGWDQDPSGLSHRYHWRTIIINEDAAQRVLPLDLSDGSKWLDAWNRSRYEPDGPGMWRSTAEALIAGVSSYRREFRCCDRFGQIHWLHEEIAVEALGPARWHLFGVVTDVTPRRQAEEAQRESEERFRTIADSAPVLVWIADTDRRCTWFNRPWLEFTGRTLAQELGNGWAEGVHPDDFQRCLQTYLEHFERRQPFRMDYRLRRHDGEYRWIMDHGVPLISPDGQFAGYVGSCIDITDRREAEEALRESQRRYELAALSGKVGIWDLDLLTDRLYLSRQIKGLLGYGPQELQVDPEEWGTFVHPEDMERVGPAMRAHLAGETPVYDLELRRRHRDGSYRWFLSRATASRDAAGKPVRLIGTLTDITDLKSAEEARRQAENALRTSERQFRLAAEFNRRLLQELDHRVRNNLAGLQSLVGLLRGKAPDVASFAAAIDSRLRAMGHVHHLLSESQWRDIDLRALVSSLLGELRGLARHAIPVEILGPAVRLPAQRALPLTMILTEFFTNSAKYGAHSRASGVLSVNWTLSPSTPPEASPELTLHWQEHGGPPIAHTPQPSLGTALIRSFASRELGGSCALAFPVSGASHCLTFPLYTPVSPG